MKLPFELQTSETILLFCRRHWLYFWSKIAIAALAGLIPIAAVTIIVAKLSGLDGLAGKAVLAFDVLWGAYWLIRGYFTWYRYNRDIWVVTDQRLLDSMKRHWFHHRMASADLVDVEDMAVVREGLLQTVFNFGDVRCQTAGEQANFILAGIPGPAKVLGVVDAARDAARKHLAKPY